MVYLDVYNSIFEYLEKIGIVDDVFEYSEEVLGPFLDKIHSNEMRNDMVVELALYNYNYENDFLIQFLSEHLYPDLNEEEKKEFDLIKESERFNLKFNKKEKRNDLDTKGKELYDFYFKDMDSNETKIIVSATALDELKHNLNARLINNPNHKGKYAIIGGIFDEKTFEAVSSLSLLGMMKRRFEKTKSNFEQILSFSKKHTLKEIDNYRNEKSSFLKQDKKIMKINNLFFERFKIGFDDFLNDFFEMSNDTNKFTEMADYYLSIEDKLKETLFDTNYAVPFRLFFERESIEGFASFIKKDSKLLEQSIIELKKRGKKEFEAALKNETSLSREKIIENAKMVLNEKVAPLKPEGYDIFIDKVNNYSPGEIKEFLVEIVGYLENLSEKMDNFDFSLFLSMTKELLDKAEKIPCLNEIKEKQKECEYIPEKFYEYIYARDEVYNLFVFLSAVYFINKQNPKKAYEIINENEIIKTDSFDMMFFTGKILSFFDDKKYKTYFNHAKKIDKKRYNEELEKFLNEKRSVL